MSGAQWSPERLRELADFGGHLWGDEDQRQAEAALRAFARVVSAMPSAERLREIADTLDFLDKLAVWVANREGWEFGQPGTKQQRELRKLADALDAGRGDDLPEHREPGR